MRMLSPINRLLTGAFALGLPVAVAAQADSLSSKIPLKEDSVYTTRYLDRSTRFAATTLGGSLLFPGGGTTTISGAWGLEEVPFSTPMIPRVSIGGVHFWGHAEFYVAFPLPFLTIRNTPEQFDLLRYSQGIETGANIYPFSLKPGRLSPYIGTSFRLLSFQQEQTGTNYTEGAPTYQKMVFPVHLGVTYNTRSYLFSLSGQYQSRNQFRYYVAPGITGPVEVSPFSVQLSVSRYWDTDKSMRRPENIANENQKHAILEKENRLSSWYWGIGPSAGLQVSASPYLETYYPQLADDFAGGFIPDITFGRFFNKPDMNIGLSYRTMGSRLRGFDDLISLRRHSFMLEAYKSLFNYLGFVPFLGVTGSVERLSMTVNGQTYRETKPALGLIFGWDIRVTRTGTNLLRTNLRYIPNLHMTVDNQKMMFNQLEFNFIQWVQFIGRNKVYRKHIG